MATTTTADIAALVPEVIRSQTLDAVNAATTFAPLAEVITDLSGVGVGDRVTVGSFGAATPALNLAETEEIVPKKVAATARSFVAGRVGDSYEHSYLAAKFSPADVQARAVRYLGEGFAQRIDLNLTAACLTDVPAGRKITPTTVITVASFVQAVETFTDEQLVDVVAVLTRAQRNALRAEVMAGGQQYAGQTIWQDGQLNSFHGVPIATNGYLPVTTAGRHAAVFLRRNRTLVSALAQDLLIEVERFPKKATVDVTGNGVWAGGVQEPSSLTVIDAQG